MSKRGDIGVYCIINKVNGKRYVGSASTSIVARWATHRSVLNKRKHHSVKLQNAWNKYGEESFDFIILIRCTNDRCIALEQLYIDKFNSAHHKYGYNVSPTAGSCGGCKQPEQVKQAVALANRLRVVSNETRKKMSISAIGRRHSEVTKEKCRQVALNRTVEGQAKITKSLTGRPCSEETRAKMSATKRRKFEQGFQVSNETRNKLSKAAMGRKHTNETKAKIGKVHKGKTVSTETKKKLSEARKAFCAKRKLQ